MSLWEQFVYNQKMIYGDRLYKYELLGSTLASAAGRVRFQALAEFNTYSSLSDAVNQVGGDAEYLGITGTGQDLAYYIHDSKLTVKISNTMIHPVVVKLYTIVTKKDLVTDVTDTNTARILAAQIEEGLVARTTTGSTSTTVKSGDYIIARTAGTTTIDTYGRGISLRESKRFMEFFKVEDSEKFVLQPGDYVEWDVVCPNTVFKPSDYAGPTVNLTAKAGVGVVVCAQVHGIVMESAAEDGNYNMAATQVCFDVYKRHRCIPITLYQDATYHEINHDTINADYAGPTEDAKAADEA